MLLNVALDRQGSGVFSTTHFWDVFFPENDHHFLEWSVLGFWLESIFKSLLALRSPKKLGNVKRDSESQVSQACGAQCLVYVELGMQDLCV